MFRTRRSAEELLEALKGFLLILRQEIPFERWYFHATDKQQAVFSPLSSRSWAVVYLGESVLRTAFALCTAAVDGVVGRFFAPATKEGERLEILRMQMIGLQLSALAVLSPEMAVEKVRQAESSTLVVGCLPHQLRWGTPYTGEFKGPFSL
jgi:hypothetical protein